MTFGQPSGPPASARDVNRLLELLHEAGHIDFRDARGPMRFTQRQAGGKFTRDEVAAFIEQLEAEPGGDTDAPTKLAVERLTAADRAIRQLPTAALAAEMQRRGWIVVEP